MRSDDLVQATPDGLYCPPGDFWIDPWRPVPRAVITHGHGDHARAGMGEYVAATPGIGILRARLGPDAPIRGVDYGAPLAFGAARVSFHPAGHVLGSAQVRIEHEGRVWVVTGDYKRERDPTCVPFEVVPCDTLITEATFALPIYRWEPTARVAREVVAWWDRCVARGVPAVLFCYALGKAQRLLAELAGLVDRPVHVHGALVELVRVYRDAGVAMLPTETIGPAKRGRSYAGELILAPPSAGGSPWMRRFAGAETAFASGWMRVRGNRRRRSFDRGFVLSDHADWPGLVRTVRESGARRVLATHGSTDAFVAWLREQGLDAQTLATEFGSEDDAATPASGGEVGGEDVSGEEVGGEERA